MSAHSKQQYAINQRNPRNQKASLQNMHKNVNNSVVIESNLPKKKNSKAGIESGVTKIGNFVGGFGTNNSIIDKNSFINNEGALAIGKKKNS